MAISTAVNPAAVARVLGVKPNFVNLSGGSPRGLPMQLGVIGQGATASTFSTDKKQVFSAFEAGTLYGFGSPLHMAVTQLLPINGDGVGTIPVTVFPLEDDGAGIAAVGNLIPVLGSVVDSSWKVKVNNIESDAFLIESGDTVADICDKITTAVNGSVNLPVTATDNSTDVDLTMKWKGASGNDGYIEMVGSATAGVTWTITQPVGGATNPSVSDALAQVGNVWQTFFVNCFEIEDSTALTLYESFSIGRWAATVRRPCLFFTGTLEDTVSGAITIPATRKTERANVQVPAPGSNDWPMVIAARAVARAAVVANDNPPTDYGGQQLTGLVPGADSVQWSDSEREAAVQGGSSVTISIDNVVTISDLVTFHHPTGNPTPEYRYVCDQVKLWNVLYNTQLIFEDPSWNSAPLIPDDQPTVNPKAKKPKMAVASIAAMIDGLALEAIISDPVTAKSTILAGISATNPKRLDVSFTVQLSGNTNVISVTLNWGFYFGVAPVVG